MANALHWILMTMVPTRPPIAPRGGGFFARLRDRVRPYAPKRRWLRITVLVVGTLSVIGFIGGAYLWVHYGRLIDQRLKGEWRPMPRIFGRPVELRPGVGMMPAQLVQRLNDIGYAERTKVSLPGEFSSAPGSVTFMTRPHDAAAAQLVRADFSGRASGSVITKLWTLAAPAPDAAAGPARTPAAPSSRLSASARAAAARPLPLNLVTLEAPMLAEIAPGEKRRYVPLAGIPRVLIDAVIDIEDRRFFEHPGVDPIGAFGALITNLRGNKPYLVGGSTLTQQIVKNTFLSPDKSYWRKLREQYMALVLESRFTKQQILELYLNDVVLGQRGPFEIHGVAEAARIFFGKDVSNLTLAEAATLAGLIQSPSRLNPFKHPDGARDRRNVVLKEMAAQGSVTKEAAAKASLEPMVVSTRALENEAPYFVDYVSALVEEKYANVLKRDAPADVYTTIDLRMQRIAQEAVANGLAQVDKQLAGRKRKGQPEAALIAVDPRTGEILAFVGGRSYSSSQYDRVVAARRQPGSAFKPFVYLAAFERNAAEGTPPLTPASIVVDEPTTFKDGDKDYTPANYENKYDGPMTLREALAKSRNIVAIKVAEQTGYDRVAALWQKVGVGSEAKPYPSIALGVFEASPIDMAAAYTLFANAGTLRPLTAVLKIIENGRPRPLPTFDTRNVARPDTTFVVTNMLRSVLTEGTGAGARASGFTLDAAGKSGTTNDLRDAWFVGFTPELLTVVWVGYDNNQPIGLSGSQAALPIWTSFMKNALAGRPNLPFDVPDGIISVEIDRDTGKLATDNCPRVFREAFLAGTEPREICDVHGADVRSMFNKLGRIFGRIIRR